MMKAIFCRKQILFSFDLEFTPYNIQSMLSIKKQCIKCINKEEDYAEK